MAYNDYTSRDWGKNMKAHIVEKTYSHGSSSVQEVFTSYKGAKEWLGRYMEICKAEGFITSFFEDCIYGDTWMLTNPDDMVQEYWTIKTKKMIKY